VSPVLAIVVGVLVVVASGAVALDRRLQGELARLDSAVVRLRLLREALDQLHLATQATRSAHRRFSRQAEWRDGPDAGPAADHQ
jgi:hypothetical protein